MKINDARKLIAYYMTMPVVRVLEKTAVTPNAITLFGFCLAVVTAVLIASGYQLIAGIVMLISGYFDIIDGALARSTNQTTRFGAVLDSTLDRVSEAVILLGIMFLFLFGIEQALFTLVSREWAVFLVGIAFPSFMLVSYIKARSETQGIDCETGIFTRTERVVVLALGLLINQVIIVLGIVVFFSLVTAVQRLVCVYKGQRKK